MEEHNRPNIISNGANSTISYDHPAHATEARLNKKRKVAEGEGFEPPEPFPVQRFSRPPH